MTKKMHPPARTNQFPYKIKKLVTLNWAIYCKDKDESSIIWIETSKKRASHLTSKLNDAYNAGIYHEWARKQAP